MYETEIRVPLRVADDLLVRLHGDKRSVHLRNEFDYRRRDPQVPLRARTTTCTSTTTSTTLAGRPKFVYRRVYDYRRPNNYFPLRSCTTTVAPCTTTSSTTATSSTLSNRFERERFEGITPRRDP